MVGKPLLGWITLWFKYIGMIWGEDGFQAP